MIVWFDYMLFPTLIRWGQSGQLTLAFTRVLNKHILSYIHIKHIKNSQ